MRQGTVAEIRPAVDLGELAKQVRKVNLEIADGERLVEATTEKLEERRERLGRILVEARKAFSARGDGFVKWVEDQGISSSAANRYMAATGYTGPGSGRKADADHSHSGNDSPPREDSPDAPAGREDVSPATLTAAESNWAAEAEQAVERIGPRNIDNVANVARG